MEPIKSPLWNYVEAALYLRVSVVSLKKMQRERKIPFVKVGRRTYFMRQDIETFLIEKCRKEPKPLTSKFEEAKARLRSQKARSLTNRSDALI